MSDFLLSNIVFSVFFILYLIVLRPLTFYQWNRGYLLAALVLAVGVTHIDLGVVTAPYIPSKAANAYLVLETILIKNSQSSIVSTIYLIGFAISLIDHSVAIANLIRIKSKYQFTQTDGQDYMLNDAGHTFSFFKWICVDRESIGNSINMVLYHERIHMNQWHSLDIIIYSIARIVFWFNPFVHAAFYELRQIHEYIADNESLKQFGTDYQFTLVNQAFESEIIPLTNTFFNQSILKQRIMKMNQEKSNPMSQWRYTLMLPALAVAVWFNSCENSIEPNPAKQDISIEASNEVYQANELDEMPQFNGGNEALYAFLGEQTVYPEALKEQNITGTVHTSFTIDAKGEVGDVTVKQSSDVPSLDQAALDVVSSMPRWKPAMKDGKAVKTQMVLPFKFELP
ncbi:MAG: M56 family metallopeptidase [Salibacteraceae bacterium]